MSFLSSFTLQVRTRRKITEHRKAARGTGGGSAPELELHPSEEGCLSLMDPTAMDGVGDADYGAQDDHNEEETPGPSGPVQVQTQDPVPPRAIVTGPTPPQPLVTPTPSAPADIAVSQALPQTPVATAPHSVPVRAVIPTQLDELEEEQSVLLDLTPVPPTPLSDHDIDSPGEEDVVASPHEYDIPPQQEDLQDNNPALDNSVFNVLQSIVQRLTALETAHGQPSANDTLIGEALLKLSKTTVTQTAALQGVQTLLESSDRARKAEAKRIENGLALLTQAVAGLTEELRLSGGKIATAIGEQTVALRQKLASVAAHGAVEASTSSSPTHSSDAPSTTVSPPPHRGIRRQRSGRRGRH